MSLVLYGICPVRSVRFATVATRPLLLLVYSSFFFFASMLRVPFLCVIFGTFPRYVVIYNCIYQSEGKWYVSNVDEHKAKCRLTQDAQPPSQRQSRTHFRLVLFSFLFFFFFRLDGMLYLLTIFWTIKRKPNRTKHQHQRLKYIYKATLPRTEKKKTKEKCRDCGCGKYSDRTAKQPSASQQQQQHQPNICICHGDRFDVVVENGFMPLFGFCLISPVSIFSNHQSLFYTLKL